MGLFLHPGLCQSKRNNPKGTCKSLELSLASSSSLTPLWIRKQRWHQHEGLVALMPWSKAGWAAPVQGSTAKGTAGGLFTEGKWFHFAFLSEDQS